MYGTVVYNVVLISVVFHLTKRSCCRSMLLEENSVDLGILLESCSAERPPGVCSGRSHAAASCIPPVIPCFDRSLGAYAAGGANATVSLRNRPR